MKIYPPEFEPSPWEAELVTLRAHSPLCVISTGSFNFSYFGAIGNTGTERRCALGLARSFRPSNMTGEFGTLGQPWPRYAEILLDGKIYFTDVSSVATTSP